MKLLRLLTAFLAATAFFPVNAADNIFDIDVKKKGAPIQSTMYGIFFEDINFAADGGLYAELVKNRSFEFPNPLQGWKVFGNVRVMNDGPFERNPHYVRLSDPGIHISIRVLIMKDSLGLASKEVLTTIFPYGRVPTVR